MNIYERVISDLRLKSDSQYKIFNDKITKSQTESLGVRMPDVKKIAKSVDKAEIGNYLAECKFAYYEDTLIYGLLLARLGADEFWKRKDEYLCRCDSWAHIDNVVPEIKIGKTDKEKFYELNKGGIENLDGFFLRFRIVMFMRFYIDEAHTDEILRLMDKLDGKGYYNDMAIAWLVSVAFVKQREKTLAYLKSNNLGEFTHNKAISKIHDSFRVSDSDKNYLKTLRK